MNSFEIKAYREAGCQLVDKLKDDHALITIHAIHGGRLCDTGCALYAGGECSACSKLTQVKDRENRPNGWALRRHPHDGHVGGVAFDCPGCGGDSYVPVDTSSGWAWEGDEQAPTLTPSLGQRCCSWHGYLTAGRFVSC